MNASLSEAATKSKYFCTARLTNNECRHFHDAARGKLPDTPGAPRLRSKFRRRIRRPPSASPSIHHQRSRVSTGFFGASRVTGGESCRSAMYCSSLRAARSLASARSFSSCFFSLFQKSLIFCTCRAANNSSPFAACPDAEFAGRRTHSFLAFVFDKDGRGLSASACIRARLQACIFRHV